MIGPLCDKIGCSLFVLVLVFLTLETIFRITHFSIQKKQRYLPHYLSDLQILDKFETKRSTCPQRLITHFKYSPSLDFIEFID